MRKKNHEERAHAPLPPSASSRWLKCLPSQGYIARLIDLKRIRKRESGPAAQRGTRIHEIAEPWLKAAIAGKKYKPAAKADKAEVAEAKAYVDYCMKRWQDALDLDPKAICGVEHRSVVTDDCWGSCDFWIFAAKRFTSIDLKTGHDGVVVVDNSQLIIYALGVIRDKKLVAREVELAIWQPNVDEAMPEKSYVYTQTEFVDVTRPIHKGIVDATAYLGKKMDLETYEARLVAGEHCGMCDALGVCPAAKAYSLSISSKKFLPVKPEDTKLPAPEELEPDQIAEIMRRAPMFQSWLEAVQVRALELMTKGKRVPGFKVVKKITRRAWAMKYTDAQIAKGLGLNVKEILESRRLSPAKVEELMPAKQRDRLNRFVFRPEGDPVVVAESDRRAPLLATKLNFKPVSRVEEVD